MGCRMLPCKGGALSWAVVCQCQRVALATGALWSYASIRRLLSHVALVLADAILTGRVLEPHCGGP